MSWFGNRQLRTKFNLIISLLMVSLLLAAAFLSYRKQQSLIIRFAIDNARSFSRQIIETRDYMASIVKAEADANYDLVPQVVATRVAKKITAGSPYSVRQVSLRYRNPDNRPDAYEAAQLQSLAGNVVAEVSSVETVKGEKVFRYLQPMVAVESCLRCHGSYESAPAFVRERFPKGHYSYDYRVGEVIGAVSVSIPMADLYRQIGANLRADLLYRGSIFCIIILTMGFLLRRTIIDPVKLLAEGIDRVTRTGNFSEQIPKRTNDEIGTLIGAFNEMTAELDRKTRQRQDSEERYRNLIEMARSPVVTFMKDGKIIITNQKAEALLGLSRRELVGSNLFDFLENYNARNELFPLADQGDGDALIVPTSIQTVRSYAGRLCRVEMEISVSRSSEQPLFTAILRELDGS
jgi:PAS domain S-box-containing protein